MILSGSGNQEKHQRPPCKKWNGSACTIGNHDGKPTPTECMRCDDYEGKSRGPGDLAERVFKATGVHQAAKAWERTTGKDCGCSKRRDRMNGA